MPEILKEFLVKLSASTDDASFRKFQTALKTSSDLSDSQSYSILNLVKAQIALTTALTGASTAILAMVDKTISANTSYRLFGQSMLLDTQSARQLKIALDAVGVSMEQAFWDPLSGAKVRAISEDVRKFGESIPDFKSKMESLEMVQLQFTRLKEASHRLMESFSIALFDALGGSETLKKITDFVDSLFEGDKLKRLGEQFAKFVVPILKATWKVMLDLVTLTTELSDSFSELIGALSGDDSIEKTTDHFEKFSKAISHVIVWVGEFLGAMISVEKVIVGVISVVTHAFKALFYLLTFQFSKVGDEFAKIGEVLMKTAKSVTVDAVSLVAATAAVAYAPATGGLSLLALPAILGANLAYKSSTSGDSKESGVISDMISGKTESFDSSDKLEQLRAAMQKKEGFYKGSQSYRHNNPGNLIMSKFSREHGGVLASDSKTQAQFPTYEIGKKAQSDLILSYANKGDSLMSMMKRYAPKEDGNDPVAYANQLATIIGADVNQKLSSIPGITNNIVVNVATNASGQEIAEAVDRRLANQTRVDLGQMVPTY